MAIGLVLALTGTLGTPSPSVSAAPAPLPDGSYLAGDGGTFTTTMIPAANRFPTGSGSQRAVARDCGHSTEVPGGRSLWLFCDTVLYDDVTGSPPDLDARMAFVPSGTAALAPIRPDPTPGQPVELHEADHPSYPTAFIRSSGTHGPQDRKIECVGGYHTVAWTSSLVTLPGTSTALALYQDHCPDIASGFAEYDVGIGEIALPDVAAGDVETGSTNLRLTAQHDSVLVNPTPGSARRWGHFQGAVVDGAYLYLYQAQPLRMSCSGPCQIVESGKVSVARVPWADKAYLDASRYRYYTGTGSDPWSTSPGAAASLIPDNGWPAGDGISVKWYPEIGRYVMSHADSAFGTTHGLSLRTSHTPWGPWSAPIDVVPDTASAYGHPDSRCAQPARCRTYLLHPELTATDKLWFSYVREGDLATADGTPVTIEGGGGMQVRLGSVPLEVLPVPPAPESTTPPGAPTAVTATAGDAQATVSWTAPSATGGSPILGYRVTPYVGSTALDTIAFTSTSTSQVVRGLANGTAHTFAVRAVTAAGLSAASTRSSAVTPRGAPLAPTAVSVVEGDEQVTLSWTAPASNGGSALTGYEVNPYVDGVAQTPRVLASTATSKVIGSLINGVTYTFTVRAVNALGTGAPSAPSPAATPRGGPGAPTAVVGVAGDSEVILSWTAPPNGGAPITGYRVTPYLAGIPHTPRILSAPVTSKDVGSLINGVPYTFRVAAVNEAGVGFDSAMSAPVTPRSPQAGAPTGLAVVAGEGRVTLSWNAPTDTGGSAITGYRVVPSIGPAEHTARVFTSTARQQVVTGLEDGQIYRFTVKALTANGYGATSEISPPVTPRSAPEPPTDVIVEPGDGMVILKWTPPEDNNGAAVTAYRITPYIGSVAQPAQTTSYGTTQWATGLTNGTTYTFTVQAVNAAGAGAPTPRSAPATPRTLPQAPGPVSAVAGDGRAIVSWTAPAWDGGAPVTGYRVTPFLGGTALEARIYSSAATTQTITGLANDSTYRFAVRAMTAAGTGATSDFSGAVTPRAGLVPPDPSAYAPFSSWDALVRGVYGDVLGRPPSATERSSWIDKLSKGTSTPGGLAHALRTSTDHQTYVDPVARLYRAYLLRTPDMDGLKFWIAQRRAGRSLNWISESFARSREFVARYGALSNAQFMDLIYRQVLERAPEPAGYDFWLKELNSGRRTRGKVMVGFSEASEYVRRYTPLVDAAMAHIFLLSRAPTGAEVTAWTTRQKAGTSPAVLLDELIDSGEYASQNS